MKIITIVLIIFVSTLNCYAYEKWEAIGSNSESTCYIDLESISKKSDSEYVIRLMFKYNKPTTTRIVTKSMIKGKLVATKSTVKSLAEIDTAILDTNKNKIYIQSGYYKTETENINKSVPPDDVIPSDSVIYTSALKMINSKFNTDAENNDSNDNKTNVSIDDGIKLFFEISKSDGLNGVEETTDYCYKQVIENKNVNYLLKCAAIDASGMNWVRFLVEKKYFSGNDHFSESNVMSRIINALKSFDVSKDKHGQIAAGMMAEINKRYKIYFLSKQ